MKAQDHMQRVLDNFLNGRSIDSVDQASSIGVSLNDYQYIITLINNRNKEIVELQTEIDQLRKLSDGN